MAIQWFPGHMHKARISLSERLKGIDVVIEMVDARLPSSSTNPMLAQMTRGKPTLKILNKQDLADPLITKNWLEEYALPGLTRAIALDAGERSPSQQLVAECRKLVPSRGGLGKPLRVLICGIPNVGKSTLINSLTGRRIAKTGNEPGITKNQQRVLLADDIELVDTPGMLWPKIQIEQAGYNLAASGAIGRNAMDDEEIALYLLAYLIQYYRHYLTDRYNIPVPARALEHEVLAALGYQRGALFSGGRVNLQKAAEIVLNDFRGGMLGQITLERPQEWQAWQRQAYEQEATRHAEREAQRIARGKVPLKPVGYTGSPG